MRFAFAFAFAVVFAVPALGQERKPDPGRPLARHKPHLTRQPSHARAYADTAPSPVPAHQPRTP